MNAETFCENFATFAEVPNGVAKLREMILQLAVQGRLVPQHQREEPAGKVLSRIDAARQRANDQGVSRLKPLPPVDSDATAVSLPSGWEWVRLGNIVNVLNGRAYAKPELLAEGPTPLLRVGNLFTSKHWYYSDLELEDDKYCDAGDLIYAWSASFGPFIWPGPRVIYHYHIWKLSPFDDGNIDKEYLRLFLQKETEAIKAAGHGVSMIHMTKEKMEKIPVPFPPLAEQRRIVAKVDQLLGLCDELAARQAARREARSTLVAATLDRLVSTSSPTEFPAHALRLRNHFDQLFDTPITIPQLRQTILQLAVQGQLVPQDPDDEPASSLIDTIMSEKEELIRDRKIRNSHSHTTRDAGRDFDELPPGWSWATLDDITEIGTGGTPPTGSKEYYTGGTIPWVTSAATNSEFIAEPDTLITKEAIAKCRLKVYPAGSLVVALYGQGKTRGQVGQLMFDSTTNQACAVIRFFGAGLGIRDYVRLVFRKKYHELRDLAAGGAQPNLNGGMIRLMRVPLPPLAEQKRIVAKVTELLALCDALEAKLTQAESASTKLLAAAVHHLLNGHATPA